MMLINHLNASSRHILQVDAELITNYFTANVLDNIVMIQFSVDFDFILKEGLSKRDYLEFHDSVLIDT
jgi:hypothetical protein